MEEWVKINGLPEGYYISNWGQVRIIKNGKEKISRGSRNKGGYRLIRANGINYYIHILVIENFTNKPDWAECANHVNGLKWDNRLSNLEWATTEGNNKHAIETGLNPNIKWRNPKFLQNHLKRQSELLSGIRNT